MGHKGRGASHPDEKRLSYVLSNPLCDGRAGCSELGSLRNIYKFKAIVPNDARYLQCSILHNNVCVLSINPDCFGCGDGKICYNSLVSFTYENGSDIVAVSGKRKKGAEKLKFGDIIAKLTHHPCDGDKSKNSDELIEVFFQTPVSGHLIEINGNLQSNVGLLKRAEGYVAILKPLANFKETIEEQTSFKRLNDRCKAAYGPGGKGPCFSFEKGACLRGDTCKFSHVPTSNEEAEEML